MTTMEDIMMITTEDIMTITMAMEDTMMTTTMVAIMTIILRVRRSPLRQLRNRKAVKAVQADTKRVEPVKGVVMVEQQQQVELDLGQEQVEEKL